MWRRRGGRGRRKWFAISSTRSSAPTAPSFLFFSSCTISPLPPGQSCLCKYWMDLVGPFFFLRVTNVYIFLFDNLIIYTERKDNFWLARLPTAHSLRIWREIIQLCQYILWIQSSSYCWPKAEWKYLKMLLIFKCHTIFVKYVQILEQMRPWTSQNAEVLSQKDVYMNELYEYVCLRTTKHRCVQCTVQGLMQDYSFRLHQDRNKIGTIVRFCSIS